MDEEQAPELPGSGSVDTDDPSRENISISCEKLLGPPGATVTLRMPNRVRSKSEMDLKEFARPLSFPHHHFRKTKTLEMATRASDSEDEEEIKDTLGQLIRPSLQNQIAPNAPVVNPLWRSKTPTAEFP